jgi:FkbM family methyltransferase
MQSAERNTPPRRVAKAVTPVIANAVTAARCSAGLDLAAAYLSILTGKGSGSGWDAGEYLAAARMLRPENEPVVVDCGANQGTWTADVRARLGHHRGRWLLIEPVAEYAQKCRRLPGVTVIETAVGEESSVMQMYVPDGLSGWMSLHPRGDSFVRGVDLTPPPVEVVKLDDLLRERGIGRVAFLKLDLEGHELFALRGAAGYLGRGRIPALTFEFGSANVNSRTFFRDFWDLLTPLGYGIHRIVPGGRTVRIARYDETLEFFRGATNYLATLPGRGQE